MILIIMKQLSRIVSFCIVLFHLLCSPHSLCTASNSKQTADEDTYYDYPKKCAMLEANPAYVTVEMLSVHRERIYANVL